MHALFPHQNKILTRALLCLKQKQKQKARKEEEQARPAQQKAIAFRTYPWPRRRGRRRGGRRRGSGAGSPASGSSRRPYRGGSEEELARTFSLGRHAAGSSCRATRTLTTRTTRRRRRGYLRRIPAARSTGGLELASSRSTAMATSGAGSKQPVADLKVNCDPILATLQARGCACVRAS